MFSEKTPAYIYLRTVDPFPPEVGRETPGIPDGIPGIEYFFSLL